MRVSELRAVKPSDVEPQNQIINITRAKGNKQRRVTVDPGTLAVLSDYIVAVDIPVDTPIFTLSSVHIWRICRKYGKMIGVSNLHPHTLRHSFAIHLIRSGHVDIRRLQQLLGHANIQTSTIYLQFRDSDLLEAYNRVEW